MAESINITSVVTEIFSGFSFRNKIEPEPDGDLYVIQMKDLHNNYSAIATAGLTRIMSEKMNAKYFLVQGDVLFVAKGSNNYAIEYNLPLPNAIAASAFFVLRPNPEKIIPAYLAWYINQVPVQHFLREHMAGTYIPNVNKSALEEITIILPALPVQAKVVAINQLRKREHALVNAIMHKREVAVTAALLDIVNK